ncbi:MAG UNVERIFIED_CONTAM: hypothetical protein LVR18_25385 [Planctomycetaceae bacterium]
MAEFIRIVFLESNFHEYSDISQVIFSWYGCGGCGGIAWFGSICGSGCEVSDFTG